VLFAGLRDDPFFNNVKGSRAAFDLAAATLKQGVPRDAAGCPAYTPGQTAAILDRWRHTDGGPARNFLAGWTPASIVLSVDLSLLDRGGPVLAVWADTTVDDVRIDRMGRPLTGNGLLAHLGSDEEADAYKLAYNAATPETAAQFVPVIARSQQRVGHVHPAVRRGDGRAAGRRALARRLRRPHPAVRRGERLPLAARRRHERCRHGRRARGRPAAFGHRVSVPRRARPRAGGHPMIARLLTGAALCLPLWAGAHDFWVNPDRFVVAVGASTALRKQVGHGDARRTSPIPSRRILRFAAWTPGGGVIDLRGDGKLAPAEAGLHLLALETDANAQRHLPADRFNAYVKDEGLWPAAAERDKRGTKGQDAIERYRRVAKALVQAGEPGEGSQDLATKRVGLPLEIVLARPLSGAEGIDFDTVFSSLSFAVPP
jgi:hypothetical protein